jgi:hypothetical protein
MRKAQGGGSDEDEDVVIVDEGENGDDYDNFSDPDGDGDADGEGGGEGERFADAEPELKKANESIGEIKQALLVLVDKINGIEETQKSFRKSQARIMQALKLPLPKKSATSAAELPAGALAKSQGGQIRHKPFTQETYEKACSLLAKSGLDVMEQVKIEGQLNKSMNNPGFQISPKYAQILLDLAKKDG